MFIEDKNEIGCIYRVAADPLCKKNWKYRYPSENFHCAKNFCVYRLVQEKTRLKLARFLRVGEGVQQLHEDGKIVFPS